MPFISHPTLECKMNCRFQNLNSIKNVDLFMWKMIVINGYVSPARTIYMKNIITREKKEMVCINMWLCFYCFRFHKMQMEWEKKSIEFETITNQKHEMITFKTLHRDFVPFYFTFFLKFMCFWSCIGVSLFLLFSIENEKNYGYIS